MDETDRKVVAGFVAALAGGDRRTLLETLDGGVRLRALLPSRFVDVSGASAVADELLDWFAEVPQIIPVESSVEPVGDLWHAGYRWTLGGLTPERVVEQHAYCTVSNGSVMAIRLVCSGFRPATVPANGHAPHDAVPYAVTHVDATIDALGEGCATLTPRIAATLRGLEAGAVLAVLTDDPSATDDIAAWSRLTGHQLVGSSAEPAGTRHYIRRA